MGHSWKVIPIWFLVGCGGSGATLPANGGDAGGKQDGNGNGVVDSGGGSDAMTGGDSMSVTDSATGSDSSSTTDSASNDDASDAACPILEGKYGMIQKMGQGCGDLNTAAPECVKQNVCNIIFSSVGPAGLPAVNGDAAIDMAGAFSGASLTLGTVARTGCTGTWDAQTQTLTIDCGGLASSQSCTVTMTRTSAMCQ